MGTVKMKNKDNLSVLSDKDDSGSAKRGYEIQKHKYITAMENAAKQVKLNKNLNLIHETENGRIFVLVYTTNNFYSSSSDPFYNNISIIIQEKVYEDGDEIAMYKEFEDLLKSETEKLKMITIKTK